MFKKVNFELFVRDLTESFIARFIENDLTHSYENASQSQLSSAVKAAVRAFKFSLNIQLGNNPLNTDMPALKLAEADDPRFGTIHFCILSFSQYYTKILQQRDFNGTRMGSKFKQFS